MEATTVDDTAVQPPPVNVIAEAAQVASSLDGGRGDSVTLGNGVVLKLKPVAPLAIREAVISSDPPSVPTYHNEAKDRDEPNPNDPDYIEALNAYQIRQLFRVSDVLLLMGSSPVTIPDDVFKPEDEEWAEMLRAVGMEVDTSSKYTRYLSWLRLYALTSEYDLADTLGRITRMSGVTEVNVQLAAAAFRSYERWRANNGAPA